MQRSELSTGSSGCVCPGEAFGSVRPRFQERRGTRGWRGQRAIALGVGNGLQVALCHGGAVQVHWQGR